MDEAGPPRAFGWGWCFVLVKTGHYRMFAVMARFIYLKGADLLLFQHTSAGDRWRKNLLRPDGILSPRIADLERQLWQRRIHTLPSDAYSGTVYQAVRHLTRSHGVSSVLEVGPGWGNCTFRLARDFSSVTIRRIWIHIIKEM